MNDLVSMALLFAAAWILLWMRTLTSETTIRPEDTPSLSPWTTRGLAPLDRENNDSALGTLRHSCSWIERSLVSLRKSVPITTVISDTTIGYHRPA
jgi:hypothetical protein